MPPYEQQNEWENYQLPPSFILGFHGCDRSVGESILHGEVEHLEPSENSYDWLGWGIYFWESNPQRAMEFAQLRIDGHPVSRGSIKEPFVLGAVINLGLCLDLNNSSALSEVQKAYEEFCTLFETMGLEIPENELGMRVRKLDCAVFNYLHVRREAAKVRPLDTVRGAYREGKPLYDGTDICRQNHIQVCVRNTSSILGYFRPIKR